MAKFSGLLTVYVNNRLLVVISNETFTMYRMLYEYTYIFIPVRFDSVRFDFVLFCSVRFALIIIRITAAKRYLFRPQRSSHCRTQLCAPSFCRNSSINCCEFLAEVLHHPNRLCLSRILSIPHSFSCHRN